MLLLDRYVTSNAAYGSARLGGPAVDTGFADWVRDLEVDRFEVPLPDRQMLLATPLAVAAERARDRAANNADRALDSFEADAGLQQRTGAMYRRWPRSDYLSPWTVLTPGAGRCAQYPGWNWWVDARLQVRQRSPRDPQGLVEVLGADPDVDVQQCDHRARPGRREPADDDADELGDDQHGHRAPTGRPARRPGR